ncbi:MAG: hypothetical protein NW220_18410 [Leptolyngbyaceae cyanobacterium bins.349]|nr:hypothetical protein [Leptolyngbyaceae cyanobacterium bins.349]
MGKRLEYTLEAVKQRLKAAKSKARLYQREERLWLQATLPPKTGNPRPKPYQQRISLGLPATEEGFRRAEQVAKLLSSRLISGSFDWKLYLDLEQLPEHKPIRSHVEEFKQHYMETHTLKESPWKNHWQIIYDRLPGEQPLTAEIITATVHATERNTRNRLHTCQKLQKLADHVGLKIDVLQYKGNYGPTRVKDRDIRSDEEIAYWWKQVPNPAWRWVYGVMAALGLRDHEVFFCEWQEDGLYVTEGKTGPRLVFEAFYPEWVDQWNLKEIIRPNIDARAIVDKTGSYESLGDKVARQFRRYKIPFPPYDLRHAYAIRASVSFGLPETTAAHLMGHSPQVHTAKYHRHIKLAHNRAATKRVMDRPDRPKPPSV